MIGPLFLLAAQVAALSGDGLPLAAIGRQALPKAGCAAYLWNASGEHRLVAMAVADPAQLRIALEGKPADYARTAQSGEGGFGFAGVTTYGGPDVSVTLDLTIVNDANLTAGASVPAATLRIDRPGRDTLILPLAGLIGCAS